MNLEQLITKMRFNLLNIGLRYITSCLNFWR